MVYTDRSLSVTSDGQPELTLPEKRKRYLKKCVMELSETSSRRIFSIEVDK